ncbi:hypothetical protein H4Q26_012141 [Puccinia striiformis f. sp. tritici PST-130]|nr:hypothetical protein H4Q26_012141 [Puccinia striiformis f. sp. tritici PST-130]
MWNCQFSRSFYLQQVHQPRHLSKPARLFGPWYLEMFTRTSWYVVPMIWLPIAFTLFHRALNQQIYDGFSSSAAWSINLSCFILGNIIWTLLEYILHRFLFHIDDVLPDKPFFLLLHFLLHGVHHYLPMDRLRLVMPPILFAALSHPFTRLAYVLFPVPYANAIISGAFTFYVLYDCTHYALHHTQLPKYLKEMKIYHMAHHFKDADLGFGVTSKIWDYAFGTNKILVLERDSRTKQYLFYSRLAQYLLVNKEVKAETYLAQ